MINKDYLTGKIKTVFGNKITDIEGWHDALNSSELYVPHHILEWKYTSDELKQMNRYYDVPADELIWMPQSVHKFNIYIHKGQRIRTIKQTGKKLKPRSDFAKKFFEHFGFTFIDNKSLYLYHLTWYRRHNNICKWEF